MSNRLDKEREKELQPNRTDFAKGRIQALGYDISYEDETRIEFQFKGSVVKLFPYSGWHTGKTIEDGRGLKKLLDQIK